MPGMAGRDVGDPEHLVERAGDPAAVHVARRALVGRPERAPALDVAVDGLPVEPR